MAHRIQAQAFHFDGLVCRGAGSTPQHGLDAGDQFAGGKRLGDVVVGAHIQPLDLVVLFALGGKHDDGDFVGGLITLEAAGQLDTGNRRQHPVQQHQIRAFIDNNFVAPLGVFRLQHIKIGQLQRNGHHFPNGGLVVNNQNTVTGHGFPSLPVCLCCPIRLLFCDICMTNWAETGEKARGGATSSKLQRGLMGELSDDVGSRASR